jgi:hypothetical protein
MLNAEDGCGVTTVEGDIVRTPSTGDEVDERPKRGRDRPAANSTPPMQSATVTTTASSPASSNVRSHRPVASRTCSPMHSVNRSAAISLPEVTRTAG